MRAMSIAAALLVGAAVWAKAPAGQGRACDAARKCNSGLTCVGPAGHGTCQLTCRSNKECGEDQRCVSDGGLPLPTYVCRPIYDGNGL